MVKTNEQVAKELREFQHRAAARRLMELDSVLVEIAEYCSTPRPRIMPLEILQILGRVSETLTKTTKTTSTK